MRTCVCIASLSRNTSANIQWEWLKIRPYFLVLYHLHSYGLFTQHFTLFWKLTYKNSKFCIKSICNYVNKVPFYKQSCIALRLPCVIYLTIWIRCLSWRLYLVKACGIQLSLDLLGDIVGGVGRALARNINYLRKINTLEIVNHYNCKVKNDMTSMVYKTITVRFQLFITSNI